MNDAGQFRYHKGFILYERRVNMKYVRLIILSIIFLTFGLLGQANAAIVDFSDVNGFKTFQDQNTGRIWLDLNNFSFKTYGDMRTAAMAAGFTIAGYDDVNQLLSSLPNPSANWGSYTGIMGSSAARPLIWGGYADLGINKHNWAWAYSYDSNWTIDSGGYANDYIYYGDMNIWAYKSGNNAVPEPATMLLLGFGLVGLAGVRRIKK